MGDIGAGLARCTRRSDGLLLRNEQKHLPDASAVLRALERQKVIVRLERGVYVEAATYEELKPWERFDLQAKALGMASGRVLAGYSAAAAWGLWRYSVVPRQQMLYRRNGGRPRRGIKEIHHNLSDAEVTGTHFNATTIERTIADLTRIHGFGAGFVAACSALRQKLVTREELAAYDTTGKEGLAHWALIVETATDAVESALEAAFLAQTVLFGDFTLIPQVSVRGKNGKVYVVDFQVEGTDKLMELDGRGKYGDSAQEQEFNLQKEKERSDNLPTQPDRFGWKEVISLQAYRTMLHRLGLWHRWDLPQIHRE
ncbi:MAG: hypothetical protein Q4G50_08730 [Corynebacterium sp.]|uniref:hypothetical protein n=1 Tax=Corynebacterium sp. TaxID=1720 RepID=UPI0026DEE0B5|nr:hypothetical protein [Corynebacterium sp.]MDO5670074.1 hypothetical protein [Corynebacterium sp.]